MKFPETNWTSRLWSGADVVNKALLLLAVSVLTAFLVADYAPVPTERYGAGDVAQRTIRAPYMFHYQDLEEYERDRESSRKAVLPVFLYDATLDNEIENQLRTSFRGGRERLAVLRAARTDEEGLVAPLTRDDRQGVVDSFWIELGVHVPADDVESLIDVGFDSQAEDLAWSLVSRSLTDRYVIASRDDLPEDRRPLLLVPQVGDREAFRFSDYERLISPDEARHTITLAAVTMRAAGSWVDSSASIARALVQPNMIYDAERTQQYADQAASSVPLTVNTVQRGATLFQQGDVLTKQHIAMYRALQDSRTDRGTTFEIIILALFIGLMFGGLYGFGVNHLKEFEAGLRVLLAAVMMILFTTIAARAIVLASEPLASVVGNDLEAESVWFLAPVAAGVILIRLLVGVNWALLYTVAIATICGLCMEMNAVYLVFFGATGLVAAGAVEHTRERMAVLRAGFYTGIFGALAVLVIHFLQLFVLDGELAAATTARPFWSMMFALTGGMLSGFIVLGLVPLFEAVGFVTDYRLMELASLNHPVLRQLMLTAPGTYHHSVIVGTLAEAGCEAVGGNSLQAKIAAFFHDIGKMKNPQYFVENQRGGENRHNALKPEESARIIIEHVTEGIRLAEEHGLPKPIVDNIKMHHGSGLLQYFFVHAQRMAGDQPIDESKFRYPGPKPNTREAGIIMLADKVEAATRTIKHPNEENIRAMIDRIINSVMADNQFSECPLTFSEIHVVADTFVDVLLGIYHQRIEYPDTKELSSGRPETQEVAEEEAIGPSVAVSESQRGVTLDFRSQRRVAPIVAFEDEFEEDDRDDDTDYESVKNLPGTV